MGLLEKHVERLKEIRRGLDDTPGMGPCWLLSCKEGYLFDSDSVQTHHVVGDSRRDAYHRMLKLRDMDSYAPLEKGYVYYVTRIGSDEIPEESAMRKVSASQIWRQVKENRLAEPVEQD